ncbi:hypothetical protein TWF730_010470 [Orbilia blumenaviensis]|uniref:Uncharacterized protein n=1 Tax=Orbilia blumenaviensis TaxID=1796055 RepID=A0AAV9UPW4_9PEZI
MSRNRPQSVPLVQVGLILTVLLYFPFTQARWVEIKQSLPASEISQDLPLVNQLRDRWTDKDMVWQYGNDGSCTGFLLTSPGAVIDTISFSSERPNFKFPWYLDHIEIHRTNWCEDPQPLKVPLETKATFLELNPELAPEISPEVADSILSLSQTEVSTSKQNSPGDGASDISELLSSPNGGIQSALNNEAALSKIDEVRGESESDISSQNSLSDILSAPGRLETIASLIEDDVMTWNLWPILQIPMPASVRFVTNYHKKHVLPVEI